MYNYCHNSPVYYIDKDGLSPQTEGSEAHRDILPRLTARINAHYKGRYYTAAYNVRNLLPGTSTKSREGVGEIDLTIYATGGGEHVYDLKPFGTSGKAAYTKKQLPKYVIGLDTVFSAKPGTALERIVKENPDVMAPVVVDKGDKVRTYVLSLPIDPKTGTVRPGFIEYKFSDVKKPKPIPIPIPIPNPVPKTDEDKGTKKTLPDMPVTPVPITTPAPARSSIEKVAKTLGVSVGVAIGIVVVSRIIRLLPPLLPLQASPI
jgi:hypothetical protein